MKYISLKTLLTKQFNRGKFAKYDIIIRYLFVKKYKTKGKGKKKAFNLYAKLAAASRTKNRKRSFLRLIKSFDEKGYDENFPLEMSKDYHVCGGTHRLGVCLHLGMESVPYEKKNSCSSKTKKFTKQWLRDNGFTNEEVEQVDKVKKKVFKKLGINK